MSSFICNTWFYCSVQNNAVPFVRDNQIPPRTRSNDHWVVPMDKQFLFRAFFQKSISTRFCQQRDVFSSTSGGNVQNDISFFHASVAVTSWTVVIHGWSADQSINLIDHWANAINSHYICCKQNWHAAVILTQPGSVHLKSYEIKIYFHVFQNYLLSSISMVPSTPSLDTLVDCKDPWWLSPYYNGINMADVLQ